MLQPTRNDMDFETDTFNSDDESTPLPLGEFKSPKSFGTDCPLQYSTESMEGLQEFVDKRHNYSG